MFIGVMPAASAVACEAEQVTAPYEFFGMVNDLTEDPSGYTDFNLTSAEDPSVLYYDFEDADGDEVLNFSVHADNKEIKGMGNFLYETTIYDKDGKDFIAWLGAPYFVVSNEGSDWYLSELLVDEDEDDTHLLEVGQTLTLEEEGLAFTPVEIDVDGGEVWFTLTRDGEEVDSSVIKEGSLYKYEEDLNESGDEDNTVLEFNVETVFAGINTNLVKINSTQLVSTEVVLVETPDSDLYDDFEVTTLGDDSLQIKFDKSDDEISLKKDGIVNFLDRFNFRMNENAEIGGLVVVIEESGIHELFAECQELPKGAIVNFDLTSALDPSILYYDFDEGEGAESMNFNVDVDNKEIKGEANFLYETSIYDKDGKDFIAWLGAPYFVVSNAGSDWYLSELLVDEDEDDTHLLEVGQTLTLEEEGLAFTPVEIDVDGGEVWFTLTRDGEEVDSSVIKEGSLYKYEEDLNESGDEDNTVLEFNVETVFAGINTNLVKINSTQLVSTEVVLVETPDSDLYDDFEVTTPKDDTLKITFDKSDDKITLKKDGIVCFLDRFNFKMNGDGDVGGVCKIIEVGGDNATPPDDGIDDGNVTEPPVDGNATVEPTEPAETDTTPEVTDDVPPVETATEKEPGFEAVFAIAGLLAVAYLVLRKRE
jgi:S-layer protein (TIGR01567 family)